MRKPASEVGRAPGRPPVLEQRGQGAPLVTSQAVDKIRILIVDDSAVARRILSDCFAHEPDLEVVGMAPDSRTARELIPRLKPDVLTLDLEMPHVDGLTFLRQLMRHHPMPVVVISSLSQASSAMALQALEEGAVEAFGKPTGEFSLQLLRKALAHKVRTAAGAHVTRAAQRPASQPVCPHALRQSTIVAIGASTGGTEAIRRILVEFPAESPPVLVTQHIPPGFSKAFAERLNSVCSIRVKEAEDGDEVRPGQALIAPGGLHLFLRRGPTGLVAAVKDGPRVCLQKPAVDILFSSVAEHCPGAIGVILTGMGADGSAGLLRMKRAGAVTLAQDEQSCVVFGMPREAIRLGAATHVLPLESIPAALFHYLQPSAPDPGPRLATPGDS